MAQAANAQSAILATAAAMLHQRTFEDITYLDLAEATGVSERTIYRRFPTRTHLLEALAAWIEREHFPMRRFRTAAEFREAVIERFRAFDAAPAFAFVAARGAALSPTTGAPITHVADGVAAMIETAAPTLNRRDARRVVATACYFASPLFWARMRTGFDMSATEMSRTFDFAMRSVMPAAPKSTWAA